MVLTSPENSVALLPSMLLEEGCAELIDALAGRSHAMAPSSLLIAEGISLASCSVGAAVGARSAYGELEDTAMLY